jgi:hypothetical protein
MPRSLDASKAREVTAITKRLGRNASFRNILKESARAGILTRHETLRRYLDLLVDGGVLGRRTRDVGSVNPQQIYFMKSKTPQVSIGLTVLRTHGLNWDVPETDMHIVKTDFEGLVRAKIVDTGLIASLEDAILHEFCVDIAKNIGTMSFVVAIISTRKLDLPYLLRRADEHRAGKAFRLLFNRILDIVSANKTNLPALIFLTVRSNFLRIVRQYTQSGFWKLVEEKGVGELGVNVVKTLTEYDVVMAAGKQLGVEG